MSESGRKLGEALGVVAWLVLQLISRGNVGAADDVHLLHAMEVRKQVRLDPSLRLRRVGCASAGWQGCMTHSLRVEEDSTSRRNEFIHTRLVSRR